MLLVTAGLLMRSFVALAHVDTGANTTQLDLLTVYLRGDRYDGPQGFKRDAAIQFADAVRERLQAVPGVEAVGYSSATPLIAGKEWITMTPFTIEGRPVMAAADRPVAQWANASPDYFRTLGIKLLQGRLFTAHDNANSPRVILINESFARRHFAGENPVGRSLDLGDAGPGHGSEIIGVVSDVAIALDQEAMPQFYVAYAQMPGVIVSTFVRTAGDPAALIPQLKAQIYAVDPDLALAWAQPFQQRVDDTVAEPRLVMRLLAVFAGLALAIAAIGIYGVISYSVSRRTAEIGIRLALGAQVGDVLRMVMGQGARLVGLGLAVGLVGMVLVGRAIRALLFHTSAYDPLTLVAVTLFFAAIAALACWLPARRAAKVDPLVALRAE
jgi:putative ABC transport system permease protein